MRIDLLYPLHRWNRLHNYMIQLVTFSAESNIFSVQLLFLRKIRLNSFVDPELQLLIYEYLHFSLVLLAISLVGLQLFILRHVQFFCIFIHKIRLMNTFLNGDSTRALHF